jgi:hypothetical protein
MIATKLLAAASQRSINTASPTIRNRSIMLDFKKDHCLIPFWLRGENTRKMTEAKKALD